MKHKPICYAPFKCDFQQWAIRGNKRRDIPRCKFNGTCNQHRHYPFLTLSYDAFEDDDELRVEKTRYPSQGTYLIRIE